MPTAVDFEVHADPRNVFRRFTDAGRLRLFIAPGKIVGECRLAAEVGGELEFAVGEHRHGAAVARLEPDALLAWVRRGPDGARWDETIRLHAWPGERTRVEIELGEGAPAEEVKEWQSRLAVLAMLIETEKAEATLREQFARLASLRRKAPALEVPDYALRRADGSPVRLSEAFGGRDEMLLVHNMGKGCVYCTLWADELNGVANHLADRCVFVLASPDEPAVMREFAASRGWKFRTLSTAGTSLARDLGFEPEPGRRWPGVSALSRAADGTITRTSWANFGPHDGFCGVWPLLDMLPRGGNQWQPKYAYP